MDVLGRLTSRTVTGDAAAETFSYDAISRLTGHTSDLGSFTLGYLGQTSQITSRALTGTSLATSRGYSSNTGDRRLASLSTAGLSSGQYSTFNFTTNAENQITGQTQTSDASVAYPPSTLSQSASYNNLNQLTNLSGQSLSWDADGNLTSDGTRTYTWDAENRLAGISYASGEAISFVYDALGRRIQTSTTPAGGGTAAAIVQLWCGWKLCQTYTMINPLNAVLSKEYYAEGEYAPGSPAISSYYAPDQIGSVRRAFQTSGASPTYDYDPYGNPLQSTAPVTDFNYAGTFYNAASGLYLATHRPYDPVSGRWLSRDPIGEAGDPLGNLYAYVADDPVHWEDPWGLWRYSQSTGAMTDLNGNTVGTGYSGNGQGLNNPSMQNEPGVGPIPQGSYNIGPQQNNVTGSGTRLRQSMRLTPNPANEMYGRSGFLIHGDNRYRNNSASEGCIIFPPDIRSIIGNSGDHTLTVVP